MQKIEIRTDNDDLIMEIELPFVPNIGEYVSIEKDEYFKYYEITERWIRISENNNVASCISVKLKD